MNNAEHNPLYLALAGAAWVLLVYRDAQRVQQLVALYTRMRHALVAVSLVGTLLRAVGMTLVIVGIYLVAIWPPGLALEPRAARTIAAGGVVLIAGWAARLVAWARWKRLYGRPGQGETPPAA